jgi:hypothetical protein
MGKRVATAHLRKDIDGLWKVTRYTLGGNSGWIETGKLGSGKCPTGDQFAEFLKGEGFGSSRKAFPGPDTRLGVDRITHEQEAYSMSFEELDDPTEATAHDRLMSSFEAGPAPEAVTDPVWERSRQIEAQIAAQSEEDKQAAREQSRQFNQDLIRRGPAALVHRQPTEPPAQPELSPQDAARLKIQQEAKDRFKRSGGHY